MSFEVLEDNTELVKSEFDSAIARALEKIGLVAERYAKMLCPVDSGNLRKRTTHVFDEEAVYIGTNVEYAPYVELGTSRYAGANEGRGFLRPAAEEHMDEYRAILKTELGA